MRGSLLTIVIACVVSCLPAFGAPAQSGEPVQYDLKIDSQPLGKALQEFAKQSGVQVIFFSRVTEGHEAPALKGKFTAAAALEHLLNDSQLTFRELNPRTIEVHPKAAVNLLETAGTHSPDLSALDALGPPASVSSADSSGVRIAQADSETQSPAADSEGTKPSARAELEPTPTDLGEVVVVGTNIRGAYPSSSPVAIYTAEDIARTGATTTEQFVRKLPQNLGTRTEFAASFRNDSGANWEGVNTIDLRGLGVGTTLTLVNGRRLGLASAGQAADISMIPVSAIERVEVLTDGASAIYGSDAIGGVVNFVLRDDFDGAETRLSYGSVSDGELQQSNFTQTFGGNWDSGHALLSYDYFSASALERADRSFAVPAGPGFLTPDDVRHGVLATFSQDLSDRITIDGDLAFSRREIEYEATLNIFTNPNLNQFNVSNSDTEQYFANLGFDVRITESLSGSVRASYSEVNVESERTQLRLVPQTIFQFPRNTDYSALDLTGMLDGTLMSLPAGRVRFSLGGGVLEEQHSGLTSSARVSNRELGRTTTYAFGELLVPLIGDTQDVPLVHRLELSLAARYTKYGDSSDPALGWDFGDDTSPKVGLLWAPLTSLNLRATYGESFRAPSLSEIDPTGSVVLLRNLPVAGVPSVILQAQLGPAADLVPETAETYTIGFDYRPTEHPGFHLGATYFSIEYTDRIGVGDPTSGDAARANPADFPDVLFRASSAAQIEELLGSAPITNNIGIDLSDLQVASSTLFNLSTFWILDLRNRNLAISELDGFDLTVGNRFDTAWGEVDFGAQVTRIFDYVQQVTSSAPPQTVVDVVLLPVDLRGRVYAGLTQGAFDGTVSINYVDDYGNPYAVGGPRGIDSWTTVDLSASYRFGENAEGRDSGIRLSLSVQNLFDQDPPFVTGSGQGAAGVQLPVGFDPANANPLGRFVALGLSKRW